MEVLGVQIPRLNQVPRAVRWGVFGAVAAAFLTLALRPAPLPVDVARAARGPLRVTVDEEGETRVRERFVMAAPTTGRLLRIDLDEGDPIEPGALLAQIVPVPLGPRAFASARARLEGANANKRAADSQIALTRAALDQARRATQRADQLREAGTLSTEQLENTRLDEVSREKEYDSARFAARAADQEVEAARAALLSAERPALVDAGRDGACERPSHCVAVHSPIAGRVLRVLEESERIVTAGTPLLEVGDPESLEIVVDVLSSDAVRIRPGASIDVEGWGGDRPLRGRVRRVEPSGFTKVSALGVEEQRVNVIGEFLDPATALGDGYRVEVRIVVWEASDVLQIPSSALFRRGAEWTVFVLEGRRARLRAVEVGQMGGFDAEIRAGLEAGDTVILHPSDRVEDGVRVLPLDED